MFTSIIYFATKKICLHSCALCWTFNELLLRKKYVCSCTSRFVWTKTFLRWSTRSGKVGEVLSVSRIIVIPGSRQTYFWIGSFVNTEIFARKKNSCDSLLFQLCFALTFLSPVLYHQYSIVRTSKGPAVNKHAVILWFYWNSFSNLLQYVLEYPCWLWRPKSQASGSETTFELFALCLKMGSMGPFDCVFPSVLYWC